MSELNFTTSQLYFIRHLLYQQVELQSQLELEEDDPEVLEVETILDKIEYELFGTIEQGT
jgi:hypothetical protein